MLSKADIAAAEKTPDSWRALSRNTPLLWQIFDNGLFCYFKYIQDDGSSLDDLARFCAETVSFAGELGEKFNWSEELFTLKFSLTASQDIMIDGRYLLAAGKEISAEIERSTADLNSGRENHAARLLRRIGESLRLPDYKLDGFKENIRFFLERR